MRTETDRLCFIDALERLSHDDDSPWESPTFAQPKKTGDIRVMTDLQKLNTAIEQKMVPLPRINPAPGEVQVGNSIGFVAIPI